MISIHLKIMFKLIFSLVIKCLNLLIGIMFNLKELKICLFIYKKNKIKVSNKVLKENKELSFNGYQMQIIKIQV